VSSTATNACGQASRYAAAVRGWRKRLAEHGGHAVVRRRVEGLDDPQDIWGPPAHAVTLMRRVKARLDPDRRLAPGRMQGGL
jgi:glycolate oxidase FAD binding subunit